MRGVRKLTHATYANQRMTLNSEIAKISSSKAEYDDRAAWIIRVACFHHSCFRTGVWRCLELDGMSCNTPRLFLSLEGATR